MMIDPEIESLPWAEQARRDDHAYRRQIAYLFAASPFYRRKLERAGFADAGSVGGLDALTALPFTEKDELRESAEEAGPIGAHQAAPMENVIRVYSTSGTTGAPSYVPLTRADLDDWIRISCRSYAASGLSRGEAIVTSYNAGPFVAGATLDGFAALGLRHIPIGSGNTERLMAAVRRLRPSILAATPSYALHLAEWAKARGLDLPGCGVARILTAGEPGGGEPATRARLEQAWGARVTEAMGIGDVAVSLWGECEAQDGMHFSGRDIIHVELIDPDSGAPRAMEHGARGELVYTHLRREAAPLLRFRSRDHVEVRTTPCACGRAAPRVRCVGRTDDLLILRGVNLFPSAVRELVAEFAPLVSGVILIRPRAPGVRQEPPLPLSVELAEGVAPSADLAERIHRRIREALMATLEIELTPFGSLPRSDYKSKLIDWSGQGGHP